MYCFKNGNEELNCSYCAMRKTFSGIGKGNNCPEIQIYKNQFLLKFSDEVIAKDFAKYFGEIQNKILGEDFCAEEIIIDLSETKYINHFCISKIVLTLYACKKNKKIKMCLPRHNNKMLRYIYNLGILDYIFNCGYIECYIGDKIHNSYEDIYDFNGCYDHSILPYEIFEFNKNVNNEYFDEEKIVVEKCLNAVKKYYCEEKEQPEKYNKVESRVSLYLQEIVDNVFKHAYIESDKIFFAINIYNSYLPPYAVYKGTREEEKFEKRINKLQKHVPMSVYKDIQDRYFGGFNIVIDDIGEGIRNTYTSEKKENVYKDVYINGTKGRRTINGLKLVADQIAMNNDILWAHDTKYWIRTSFIENNQLCKEDESKTLHYDHLAVMGLCYDIFINLSQNSIEKRKTYEKFGIKCKMSVSEIKEMISMSKNSSDNTVIDNLNVTYKNVSMQDRLNVQSKFLFYRPRATQKNKMANEIGTRVLIRTSDESNFKYLVIYDLNQTTLFQAKAALEYEEITNKIRKIGIDKIILLTEDSWFFAMVSNKMNKDNAQKIFDEIDFKILFSNIHKNDESVFTELLLREQKNYVTHAQIYWGRNIITEYIDVERMIWDRAFSDILHKALARISGLLSDEQKIVFLENYLEAKFGAVVNEFKKDALQKIYLGSILMTGDTEKKVSYNDDIKIYLFRHKESNYHISEEHVVLFDLPVFSVKKSDIKYRRAFNTNRIERFEKNSDEYNFYSDKRYEKIISNIPFNIGIFETGFIKIVENDVFNELFLEFVLEIIKLKLSRFDKIRIEISETIDSNFHDLLNTQVERINSSSEYRGENKSVNLDKDFESELVIRIQKNIDIIELISKAVRSPQEILFVSQFCSLHFDSEFYKIVDAGYMPFLPFYYAKNDVVVDSDKINNFRSFLQTLNPKYRNVIERNYSNLAMNSDLNLAKYGGNSSLREEKVRDENKGNLLWKLINANICDEFFVEMNSEVITLEENVLTNLLLLQHSILKLDISKRSLNVNEIFSFILECEDIFDSVITYMMLITLINLPIDYTMFNKFYDKEIAEKVLNSESFYTRILFADFYNKSYLANFQPLLNEFFVSNDITIYYTMLSQLLFNIQHGRIHDSKIDKIYKKLDENIGGITQDDINEMKNLIPNCIYLLKLTRSYDKSIDAENALEREFNLYSNDIENNLLQVKMLITKIKDEGTKRFTIINKINVINDVREYVLNIIESLKANGYQNFEYELSNINVNVNDEHLTGDNGFLPRDLKLYNDSFIVQELAYLLHNAHNHSYKAFSIAENYKMYKVWIKAELKDSVLVIRLLNSIRRIDGNYEEIMRNIYGKKRIGKTYLEKFNINVSYIKNPKDILFDVDDIDVLETHIEIPYFN